MSQKDPVVVLKGDEEKYQKLVDIRHARGNSYVVPT